MYIQPNSIIEIFKGLKLNRNSEDTLLFATRTQQNTFFESLDQTGNRIYRETNFTYIRPESKVRVKGSFAQLSQANYLRFYNMNFDNKWYYAFVREVKCLAENDIEIAFELDDMQTWLPGVDYTLTECYIERQHQTGHDNIGDNTVPENIMIDAYHPALIYEDDVTHKQFFSDDIDVFSGHYYIVLMMPHRSSATSTFGYAIEYNGQKYLTDNGHTFPANQVIDNIPCSNAILLFDMSDNDDVEKLGEVCAKYGDNIISSWVLPYNFVTQSYIYDKVSIGTISQQVLGNSIDDIKALFNYDITLEPGSSVSYTYRGDLTCKSFIGTTYVQVGDVLETGSEQYTFKNKKCLSNPFTIVEVVSPNGQTIRTSPERFNSHNYDASLSNHQFNYKVVGSLIDTSITVFPYGYEVENGLKMQITLPKPPVASIVGSSGGSAEVQLLSTVLKGAVTTGLTALTGGNAIAGAAGGMLVDAVYPEQKQEYVNNLSNIALWGQGIRTFEVTKQYAENYRAIDNYFDAFGYAQNKREIPNLTGRSYWTYIKTRNANHVSVNVPADAMERINAKFDAGIRFHTYYGSIGNLSQYNNAIV